MFGHLPQLHHKRGMLTDGIVLQCAALVISMLITVDWRQIPNMRASLVADCFSLCNDVRIEYRMCGVLYVI